MVISIHIDESVCKGCVLCLYYCPRGVFAMSDRLNRRGNQVVEVKDLARCTGCRLCEISCPDLAIFIDGVGEHEGA